MRHANELMTRNQLEACDGLSYLVSLDDGLPQTFNIESYIRIVKDKAILRKIIFASQNLMNRCLSSEDEPSQILAGAEETLLKLGESQVKSGLTGPGQIIDEYQGGLNAFLDPSKRIKGISTGFRKLDEMTSGLHAGELIILAARPSMGKTALALNIAQHVAAKLRQDGRDLLARDVEGIAADAHGLRERARRQPEIPRWVPELRRAAAPAVGGVATGARAAVHRRYGGREPERHACQAAPLAGGAEGGAGAGGGGLPAVDERPWAVRKSQPGDQQYFARIQAAVEGTEHDADAGAFAD